VLVYGNVDDHNDDEGDCSPRLVL